MLGTAFSQKCYLSPVLKIHIYRTFTSPIIRSGLSSFAFSSSQLAPLALFHRKTLKSFLNLSKSAPTPAVHFILGELPIEGRIHRDMFSLFYSVWSNPNSKIYLVVKYLLSNAPENSRTWSAHIKYLSNKYKMWDPVDCLKRDPPRKSEYKEYVNTKIATYFEKHLRTAATENSCMKYLNVSLTGLRGRHHPSIANIKTTEEVKKMRPHLKMLCGNLLTYGMKFEQTGLGSARCRLCDNPYESVSHIVSSCPCYNDVRTEILEEFSENLSKSKNCLNIQQFSSSETTLTQLILDPSSMNLEFRVHIQDPILSKLFSLSRDLCYAIIKRRSDLLSNMEKKK